MKLTSGTKLTDEQIARLESIGFRRWTKYGKDRLYANADVIGMELDFYKSSGAIRSSKLNGEPISHRQAGKILDRIDGAYIDVMTGKIYAKSGGHEYIEAAVEAVDDTESEPEEEDLEMKEIGYMERMRTRSCEDQMSLRQIRLQMMAERKANLQSQIDELRPLWKDALSFDFGFYANSDLDRRTLWRLSKENDARVEMLSEMLAFLHADFCTGTGVHCRHGREIYFAHRMNPYILREAN